MKQRRIIVSDRMQQDYSYVLSETAGKNFHPDFAPAPNTLVIAYLEKGENDLAVEHCDKALALGYEVAPQIIEEIEDA